MVAMRTYALVRPVFVFSRDTGKVLKVEGGELITLFNYGASGGITAGVWCGRKVLVFREDVENNGTIGDFGVWLHGHGLSLLKIAHCEAAIERRFLMLKAWPLLAGAIFV